MEYQLLNQKNPSYCADLILKYRCLYSGGQIFRKNISKFLPQNKGESPEIYRQRVDQSSYRAYVGQIIDSFSSQVFSIPFIIRANDGQEDGYGKLKPIDLDPFYSEFKEDCDLKGTDLSTFLKHQLTTSLICGKSYWLAELPEKTEDVQNLIDYQENNLGRAKISDIEPECIFDYEIDDDGNFEFIVLHYKEFKRNSPAESRQNCTETWRIYFPDRIETYQITYNPNKNPPKPKDIIPLIPELSGPHGFDKVPIICMELPMGLWLMDRVSDAQIEHFRLSAANGWLERRSAYAMGVFNVKDKTDPPQMSGSGIMIGLDEKFNFAEPSGTANAILQKDIQDQKDEIYRVSQQMAQSSDNSSGSIGRSGQSKMADQEATKICCKSYGIIVREAIEKTLELISDARGELDTHFSIEGMDQYDFTDPTTLIENAKVAKDLGIIGSLKPLEALTKEVIRRVANVLISPDTSQNVKDDILKEIDESSIEEPQQNLDGINPFDKSGNKPNVEKGSAQLPFNNEKQ